MATGILFYLKYDFHFFFYDRFPLHQPVKEFAEQVFSALSELHSDVKHLSEVHVVFYDEQWAQKFIMAIQQCVEDKTQTKGSVIEKIAG